MLKDTKTYEGTLERDIYGSWEDCSPGLYLDHDRIQDIFREYDGKRIRVTIETIPDDQE